MSSTTSPTPWTASWDSLSAGALPDAVKAGLRAQSDAFWQVQARTLDAVEALTAGWLARRRAGVQAAREAAAAIAACSDPVEAVRACQAWATGSVERLTADVMAAQSQLVAMAPLWAASLAPAHLPAVTAPPQRAAA
jgi:hypothetical protein